MYIRTTARRNRDGTIVRYLHVAHNERDPQTGMPRARVLYNFGRGDAVDRGALARLVRSVSRFLSPEDALHAQATAGGPTALRFVGSRPLGGAWVLEHLWRRVGIRAAIVKLLRGRKYALPVERALFALVANRALAPASKLACERWVTEEVVIPELPQVPVHHPYRAMDFVLEAQEEVQREVFFATRVNYFGLVFTAKEGHVTYPSRWTRPLYGETGRTAYDPRSQCTRLPVAGDSPCASAGERQPGLSGVWDLPDALLPLATALPGLRARRGLSPAAWRQTRPA
ncbi:MAG: hypothetical protein QN123_12545, partial [Armatimonadota bacterium]|nr:hypothetical protein [Armatimonadota bacterium]